MDKSDIAGYIYGARFRHATVYGGWVMENRIVEIAQKKARHRSGKAFHTNAPGRSAPMFFTQGQPQTPPARFPTDIRPERRPLGAETSLAFVLAAPVVAPTETEGVAQPKKRRASPKRKRSAKATRPRAKPLKTAAAKSACAKTAAADRPVTLVADLTPPVIPTPVMLTPVPGAEDPATPLPRARAVAVYRKTGLFDVIGYWLRSSWTGLASGLRARPQSQSQSQSKPKPKPRKVAQLLAENDMLRREVARLRADLARGPR